MCTSVEMKGLVDLIKLSPPDLMVVSMEGMKFPTWKLLLAMHSPMLADLLLEKADEGLLAVSLPLAYVSISSMLAILGEGRRLDQLGEAALLLGNKIPSSIFVAASSPVSEEEGSCKKLPKAEITDKDSDKDFESSSSSSSSKQAFEISSASNSRFDFGVISKDNATGTLSEKNDFELGNIDSESEMFDSVVTSEVAGREPDQGDVLDNVEDAFDNVTDNADSKQSITLNPGPETCLPYSGSLAPGVVFQNYDLMMASLNEWSLANFSPLATTKSGGVKNHHIFGCPHRRSRKKHNGGIGQQRKKLEYADCPFLISLKGHTDGSYMVTRVETEHKGHEVSEEQFEKYRKPRRLSREQEDAVLASLTQGGKLPQIANMLSDFTGRKFTRNDVYSLVKRLQKPFLVIDTDTGEEKVEFRGVQVAAQGLGLSQSQSRRGQESKLE